VHTSLSAKLAATMQRQAWTWTSPHFAEAARLIRWGHFGTPVLIFPTAGGDFEEIERFQLISALGELIDQGRMKAYSVDGLCVRAWLSARSPAQERAHLQKACDSFDSFLYEDVLQRIRVDCQNQRIEPILAGASRGAAIAVGTLCRHPDSFRAAIGVSGLYDWATDCSAGFEPLASLTAIAGPELEKLRQRVIILGTGEGDYERPGDSRHLSQTLAAKGIPCRLNLWGPARSHTWSTWRDLFPRLLAQSL
jgi:esterase/lipase superfamily enzyme